MGQRANECHADLMINSLNYMDESLNLEVMINSQGTIIDPISASDHYILLEFSEVVPPNQVAFRIL